MKKRFINIMNSKTFFKVTTLLFGIGVICLSMLLSNAIHIPKVVRSTDLSDNKIIHDSDNSYTFTNPVLDCESYAQGEETVIPGKDLDEKINSIKAKYNIDLVSLYFRDLNNGPWLGVNVKDSFSPGSLVKTPYFISFLRYMQDNPKVGDKKVLVADDDVATTSTQNIKPASSLTQGREYTLREVAENTIKYSDNAGLSVLMKNVPSKYVSDIYSVLGNVYSYTDSEFQLSVKDASSFFRILYNASYLDRDMSEYALKIFSQSQYKDGLVAGVPEGILVAHKFGERSDPAFQIGAKNVIQLHDCGIVYYPGKPYALCIMTRGTDLVKQGKSIAEISKYFYDKIDEENKK